MIVVMDALVMLGQAADEKDRDADQLDIWADESRRGGWSTHQVDLMMKKADGLRREAAILRRRMRALEV